MRTQLLTGALAVVATSALVGLGTTTATARVAPAPEKTHEVGTLIECAGYVGKVPVRVNLYESRSHGNTLEVLLHDGTRREIGRTVETRKPFVVGEDVLARTRVGGRPVLIHGTTEPTGKVQRMHEVHEDAGERVVVRGTHAILDPKIVARYGGTQGRLTCDNAFDFDLRVSRTSLVD